MDAEAWSMGEGLDGEGACDFRCLHRTARGRIFRCREFRRVVIEFEGTCLVLREGEFQRLLQHFGRIAACGLTRSRLAMGERIRLRDATGGKALILDLAAVEELAVLMESGNAGWDPASGGCQGVAKSLGASPAPDPLSIGATKGYPLHV